MIEKSAQLLRTAYISYMKTLSHQERCAVLFRKIIAHQKEWIIHYIMDEMDQINKSVDRQSAKQVVDSLFYQAKKYFYTIEAADDAISAVLEDIITKQWFKDPNLQDRSPSSILGLLRYSKIPQILQNLKKSKSTKTKEKEIYQRAPKDDEAFEPERFYQKPEEAMKNFQRSMSKAEWNMMLEKFDEYMGNQYVLKGNFEGFHPLDIFDRYIDGESYAEIATDIGERKNVDIAPASIKYIVDKVSQYLKKFLKDQTGILRAEDLFQGAYV